MFNKYVRPVINKNFPHSAISASVFCDFTNGKWITEENMLKSLAMGTRPGDWGEQAITQLEESNTTVLTKIHDNSWMFTILTLLARPDRKRISAFWQFCQK